MWLTLFDLELRCMGGTNSLRQRYLGLLCGVPRSGRFLRDTGFRCQHLALGLLHHWWHHLLSTLSPRRQSYYLYGWHDIHVFVSRYHWRSRLGPFKGCRDGHRYPAGHFDTMQHDHDWSCLLPNRGRNAIRETSLQNDRHRTVCLQPYRNLQ